MVPSGKDGGDRLVVLDGAVLFFETRAPQCFADTAMGLGKPEINPSLHERLTHVGEKFHSREVERGNRAEKEDHEFHIAAAGLEKLEEAVNTLGGIRTLRSYNLESLTQLVIEFELEVKGDQAVQDVRDRVSRIQRDLPPQADPPIVEKFDIGAAPIMYLALSGNIEPRKLTILPTRW